MAHQSQNVNNKDKGSHNGNGNLLEEETEAEPFARDCAMLCYLVVEIETMTGEDPPIMFLVFVEVHKFQTLQGLYG